LPRRADRRPRGVVDTSVLVAGIAGFKRGHIAPTNDSGRLLRAWVERHTFTWLVSDEVVEEYKEVLARLHVRRGLIGRIVNLMSEEAEFVAPRSSVGVSPDPDDEPFCSCSESGKADFIVTLNPKDFPQERLTAKVLAPGEPLPAALRRPAKLGARRSRR
jgi:predicted nucleic acid-binding protein